MLTVTFKQSRTQRLPEGQLSLEEILSKGCYKFRGRVHFFGPPVMRTCFREGNYVEPTIVTGLPHDAPVVHRWISTKGQKIELKNENGMWTVKVSQLFSCESIPLSTPVKVLSWHQLGQKLTCVTSFENVDTDGAFWSMSKKNNKTNVFEATV